MDAVIIIVVLLIVVVALALGAMSIYNGLVRQRNVVQESWRQVDVELNRRYDLIPNLVETVKGFASHERGTLEDVVRLRNQAAQLSSQGAPNEQRAQVEQQLTTAVHNLIVSVEAYPQLRANVNFLELQRELTATEDRIAAGRRYYNANVRNYNTKVESVPSNIVANMFKFEKAIYFEANDPMMRQAPSVSFGGANPEPRGSMQSYQPSDPNALPNPQAASQPQAQIPQGYEQPQYGQQQYPQQQYQAQPDQQYRAPGQ